MKLGTLAHVLYIVNWLAAFLGQFGLCKLYKLGGYWISAINLLEERNLLSDRRSAGGWIVEMLKDHVGETVLEFLKRNLCLVGKDTLNGEVFEVVEI